MICVINIEITSITADGLVLVLIPTRFVFCCNDSRTGTSFSQSLPEISHDTNGITGKASKSMWQAAVGTLLTQQGLQDGQKTELAGSHARQKFTLKTETDRLKHYPYIPLAFWQASEKFCCSTSSVFFIPYYWSPAWVGDCVLFTLHSKRLYTTLSQDWNSLHIFGPPTQLQQAACSIQVLSPRPPTPSLPAKDSTLGSRSGANHMLALPL